jgi:hypothetical protein
VRVWFNWKRIILDRTRITFGNEFNSQPTDVLMSL